MKKVYRELTVHVVSRNSISYYQYVGSFGNNNVGRIDKVTLC